MGDLSKNFSRDEFKCKCGCGKSIIDMDLIERLQRARDIFGESLVINSATRCSKHNDSVNGAKDSQHLFGKAVDLKCTAQKFGRLFAALYDAGFRRFGWPVSRTYVHVDIGPIYNGVCDIWCYPKA